MLERYLINTLQHSENNFSDALDPHRIDTSGSLMGEHEEMKPASTHEVRSMTTSILDAINGIKTCQISPSPVAPTSDMQLMPSSDIVMVTAANAQTRAFARKIK